MNEYEQKKQDRIERYEERAEKARGESAALHRQADSMLSAIPPGQPVHGRADRAYRDRAFDKIGKAVAADEKAAYYEQKAEAARNNRAISSDDPEALEKLTKKLEGLKASQEYMKRVNAYYRKNGTCQGCDGVSDELAVKLDEQVKNGYSWEKAPFPSYELSNNNQEIHRIQARIERLSQDRENGFSGWEFDGGKVVANSGNNRLQVFFDEIPSAEVRQEMKGRGFRWARSEGAWQRQLTQNAIYAASRIEAIRPIDGSDPCKLQPRRDWGTER